MLRVIAVPIAMLLFSCEQKQGYEAVYFDIDSLIAHEVHFLDSMHARLDKTVWMNGQEERHSILPDSTGWYDELAFSEEIGLMNRPVYVGSYVENDTLDAGSNLQVHRYLATDQVPIRYLYLYRTLPGDLRMLKAHYRRDRRVYRHDEFIQLEFERIFGNLHLTGYELTGGQKVVFGDSAAYRIRGRITYPDISGGETE